MPERPDSRAGTRVGGVISNALSTQYQLWAFALNSHLLNTARGSLALLSSFAWIRRQRPLRVIYRILPQRFRSWLLAKLTEHALNGVHFSFPDSNASHSNVEVRSTAVAPELSGKDVSKGVNIFGYLRGQFGLGESARMYAQALLAIGYPVALIDIDIDLPHSLGDASLADKIGTSAPYPINLIFVNPDYLHEALETIGQVRREGSYTIACWFWELERIPDDWSWAIDEVDEIMVASTFVEEAFRKVTDKPILLVPLPISGEADSGLCRRDFGLGADKFVFLTTFDFHSSIHRKNPLAAIAAFRTAFPPDRDDVRLVVKSSNGHQHTAQLLSLLSSAMDDSRIIVRDQVLDRAQMHALQRCADAYVSLHRAEGFGLGLAECMAMGKPVIGTGWSGNIDFMTRENSCLAHYTLVPVKPGEYPHVNGARWAEADTSHAADLMKRLADDREFARDLGTRAARDIREKLSPVLAASKLIDRLNHLTIKAGPDIRIRGTLACSVLRAPPGE